VAVPPSRSAYARLERPSPRGIFRIAAAAVVMVAAGVTAGSAPAAAQQAVTLMLRYTCVFPPESRSVSVQVSATYPTSGRVGQPIQPTGTGIAVALPQAAVADLARLTGIPVTRPPAEIADVARPNPTAVRLTASVSTKVTEGTRRAAVIWRDLRSPATAISRSGPLTLIAFGSAPPVTAPTAGEVTITASGLSLLFTARTANIRQASPSGGTSPPANPSSGNSSPASRSRVRVACAPRLGQDTTLARIAVARSAPARQPVSMTDDPKHCRPYPKHLKLNPRFPLPTPPPGSNVIHGPQRACSNAAGYTNARKLKEAALVGPGLTDLKLGLTTYTKTNSQYSYLQQRAAGQLEFHGRPVLPPARATLLALGFVPVSATIQISEIGSLNIALVGCAPLKKTAKCPNPPPLTEALFFGFVSLRISNVHVNGVPLNVGPHCQTVTPFNLELVGVPPTFSTLTLSGILTGDATIPKFTGCHNGADTLDPIFDASVSGPGNFVKVNEAPFCSPDLQGHPGCPPVPAKPVH
jgi:hypothetical protein